MKEIPLTRGHIAIVDDEDFEWLSQWKWHARGPAGRVYATRNTPHPTNKGRQTAVYMHCEITNAPKGMVTDHANHNTLDNRRQNLRVCSHADNSRNRLPTVGSASQFLGVSRLGDYWHASIRGNSLGSYVAERDAALAYDRAAEKLYGEFANLNFPGASELPQGRRTRASLKRGRQHAQTDNKTGYRGVFNPSCGTWAAKCSKHYIGAFESAEAAARAYDAKARELYGPFARVNFPHEAQP